MCIFDFKNGNAAIFRIIDDDITAAFTVFPVGFYGLSGSGKNACQKSMVEVFFIIVIADGFSEKTVHFFGGSSTVFGPDGIK